MMKQKPTAPYQRLLNEIHQLVFNWRHRHTVNLFSIPKLSLESTSYTLIDIYHKVHAADQLGYDVVLEVRNNLLVASYKKRVNIPYHMDPNNG
jgi:hypothetical protein